MIYTKIAGLLTRHAMTVLGGWLIAEGYTDEATMQTISGGMIAATGVAMSLLEKQLRF